MACDGEWEPDAKRLKTQKDLKPETDDQGECCGICLTSSESGMMRGEIESCSHTFCFVCIMEWAKVESRCPLCKRRFAFIRRPPLPPLFPIQRLVNIPLRDQIYLISGNATIGPPDPYSNVRCCVCDSVGDEHLLLLCDLCDSASHTHCVGLGATVPEGDWFCHDCTLSKAEHEKIEEEEIDDIEGNTSIEEILRESRPREVNPTNRIQVANLVTTPSVVATINAPVFSSRTLQQCRNVHVRVQALRENWSAIRSGSVSFPSSSIDSHKHRNETSTQSDVTPTSSHRVASRSSSLDKKCSESSCDVDKAWKMMNKAKSMKQHQEKTNQSHKHILSKLNNPFEEARSKSFLVMSNSKSCGPQKHHSFCPSTKEDARHSIQKVAKQKQVVESKHRGIAELKSGVDYTRPTARFGESYMSSHSQTIHHESPVPFRNVSTSIRDDSCSANGCKLSNKHLQMLPSDHMSKVKESVCLPPPPSRLFLATSNGSSVKSVTSSSFRMDLPNEKVLSVSNEARRDDRKSNIQVLVKLSLKLLNRDRKLDVEVFKEIARLATHSIMAACGLEQQPKPGSIRSFPSSVCWHTNQVESQPRMSTLMPDCCRECFHVFVKDVVNSILVERLGSASA